MSINQVKQAAIVAALVASTALPHVAAAQSAESSDPAAAGQDAPASVVVDSTPAEDELYTAVPAPDPMWDGVIGRAMYLNQLNGLRSSWRGIENGVDKLARQQRLGIYDPSIGKWVAQQYSGIVPLNDQLLAKLSPPPPQFAHVYQLHLAAAAEFNAALTAAQRWLTSDDQSDLSEAQTHFAQFDQLIGQAVLELS